MEQVITLTESFIEEVKESLKPHWGELGWVTYKRTYARFLSDKNRLEEWHETVKRVVEGNINLDPRLKSLTASSALKTELQVEAQQLFRLIYGLSATPSGRNLWISGTDYQKRNGDALNNCWFVAIRPQNYGRSHILPPYLSAEDEVVSMPFSFLFDQLMKGGGVGFSVVRENIAQIPVVAQKIELTLVIGQESAAYEESLATGAIDREIWLKENNLDEVSYYEMPDTREGWVLGNAELIDLHFSKTNPSQKKHLVIDLTNIRARGAKIKGFGGTASGPEPLIEMLLDINQLLNQQVNQKLSAVHCTDICNLIGKAVVAGNVRRSAELALGSADDEAFVTMKQDQTQLYHHRWASNNSITVDSTFTDYDLVADSILHNGEPGIVNLELSKHYGRIIDGRKENIDGEVEGTNPCGEISLSNGEPCNLFEVFPAIAQEQGWRLEEVFELAVRYTKRITFSEYDWEISRKAIQKNRRIGVSMSGIQDWILKAFGKRAVIGFEEQFDEKGQQINVPIYNQQLSKRFTELYRAIEEADQSYSEALNCQSSIKHTTVKPSGTVSKLSGASEGMHFHYSGYLIQRIRFQDHDPLLPALEQCGYKIEPDLYTPHTMCVEFPIKAAQADSPEFASAGTVSIAEQFATQAFLQTYWSDNAVSCTITFQPDEASQIADLLRQYRSVIKSTSLLPYMAGGFKQAPKEPISKTTYEAISQKITGDVAEIFAQLTTQKETEALELVNASDCDGGACPIR